MTLTIDEIRTKLSPKTIRAMRNKAYYVPRPDLAKRWGFEPLIKIAKEEREAARVETFLGKN